MEPSENGLHLGDTSNPDKQDTRGTRHKTYYIPTGDVVFQIEDTLFRVHRYFLERESALFRDMLSLPAPTQQPEGSTQSQRTSAPCKEGLSDENPIRLPQVSSNEFEAFLWVFYNPKFSEYDAPASTWTSILRLAHLWDFPAIRDLAFRHLGSESPVKRLALGDRYDAPTTYRAIAMSELVAREEPLSLEDGEELGMSLVLEIAELREKVRAARDGRRKNRFRNYHVPRSRSRSRSPSPHALATFPDWQPPLLFPPQGPPVIIQHPPQEHMIPLHDPFEEDEDWVQAVDLNEGPLTSKVRRVIRFFKKAVRRR